MKNIRVAIISAVRTPIGSFMGSLSSLPAPQLGSYAIKGALEQINLLPNQIDEVFLGNVLSAGIGQAPAKQASLGAGIASSVSCTTIDKVCSSGLKSIIIGAQSIQAGDNETVVAGGMENMSLVPHYTYVRKGQKFGSLSLSDGIQTDGLTDVYSNQAMGICAESCATKYNITREQQDAYTLESYTRATKAWQAKTFNDEIIPIPITRYNGEVNFVSVDEEYTNVNFDKIPSLKPAFIKNGTITAANASTLSDGAAVVILMSEEKAKQLNLSPLAYITSYADASQDPEWFTTSPTMALTKAMQKANLSIDDIDLFEINEAFAVVSLANASLLNIPSEKLNIKGGAVSLGHPLGCSGARILVTLLHAMKQQNLKTGAVAICNGGGGASAMIIERN